MTYLLAPFVEEDFPEVVSIEDEIFGKYAWSSEVMRAELSHPQSIYYVSKRVESGSIVGYGGIRIEAGEQPDADIQTLAILRDFRGLGLGRKILRRLLLEARERGAGSVFLEVRADNFAAINLYISENFEKIGLRPGYYQQDGADAISMKSEIVGPRLKKGVKNV